MTDHPGQTPAKTPALLPPNAGWRGPVPWMVAVMTALAMLGLVAALSLGPAANDLSGQIAGRATVQLAIADPLARRAEVMRLRTALEELPYVRDVHTVPESELRAAAAQWLGEDSSDDSLALPALIDVDLVADGGVARLRADVARLSREARVIAHADWLGPVAGLMRSIAWLAAAAALMLGLIAVGIAMLAARSALASQQATITILHLVGATDAQIARLFQAQVARDTGFGALAGGLAGLAATVLVLWQLTGLTSGLATSGNNGVALAAALAVPPLVVIVAVAAARWSVLRALGEQA